MRNILTRERLLIREAAVHWDQSFLGMLTKAVFSPLSWLKGSLKKGIRLQQVNGLVMQWGIEYVKALKAVDLPENIDSSDADSNVAADELTAEDRAKDAATLEATFKDLKVLSEEVNGMKSWRFIDTQDQEYSAIYERLKDIEFSADVLLSVLKVIKINEDTSHVGEHIALVNKFLSIVKKSKDIRSFSLNIGNDQGFLAMIKSLSAALPQLEDIYELAIRELKSDEDKDPALKESMINEAGEYTLPSKIESLFSRDMLDQMKQVDNIKVKTLKTLNLTRLNAIRYEANYVIDKAGKSNDKDDSQAKLKKTWEQGMIHTNDYFQDVIDINYVVEHVTGHVDAKTAEIVQQQQGTLDQIQQLGLSEVFPVGTKFDVKTIYAFQGLVKGQNGKSSSQVLFMSPTENFSDQTAGVKYYVFKLLGSYRYDSKTKQVVRFNTFNGLTANQKMVDNFKNVENSYYIMLTALRPGSYADMFVYSNSGKYFFNQDIVPDVASAADAIRRHKGKNMAQTLKGLGPASNVFKFRINQRFVVDQAEIEGKKYPGVQLADGTTDKDVNVAKMNHAKLINIIGDKVKIS